MDKRDPLKEVGNMSDNNEPQEAEKEAKVPEITVSSDKENEFTATKKSGTEKAGSGKLRLSFLKAFDPLYSESSQEKSEVSDEANSPQKVYTQQYIITEESSDTDLSQVSPLPADVSDDDGPFVDATYIATSDDDARSEKQVPENSQHHLDESLLKFYTPEKFDTTLSKNIIPESTSQVADGESVLSVKQTEPTSVSDQLPLKPSKLSDSVSEKRIHSPGVQFSLKKQRVTDSEVATIRTRLYSVDNNDTEVEVKSDSLRPYAEGSRSIPITDSEIGKEIEEEIKREEAFGEDSTEEETSDSLSSIEKRLSELLYGRVVNRSDLVQKGTRQRTSEREVRGEKRFIRASKDLSTDEERSESESGEKDEVNVSKTSLESELESSGECKDSQEVTEPDVVEEDTTSISREDDIEKQVSDETSEEEAIKSLNTAEKESTETSTDSTNILIINEDSEQNLDSGVDSIEESCLKSPKTPELEEQKDQDNGSFVDDEVLEECTAKLDDQTSDKNSKNISTHSFEDEQNRLVTEISEQLSPEKLKTQETDQRVEKEPETDISSQPDSDFESKPPVEAPEKVVQEKIETVEKEEPVISVEHHSNIESNTVPTEAPEKLEAETEGQLKKTEEELGADTSTTSDPDPEESKTLTKPTEVHPEKPETQKFEKTEKEPETDISIKPDFDDERKFVTEVTEEIVAENLQEKDLKRSTPVDPTFDTDNKLSTEVTEKIDSTKPEAQDKFEKAEKEPEFETSTKSDIESKLLTESVVNIEQEKLETQNELEKAEEKSKIDTSAKPEIDLQFYKSKMADLSEKLNEQQQENSDLKLQLNGIQQAKASLELEIRQKEEVIIKTQAEAMKNEQLYKQEIKQLREKLKENSKLIEKDGSKELEEQLKEAKAREAKAIAELNQRTKDDLNYQKIMEEYENTIATRFADYQKLKEEHETATRHLANIELAFSDLHQKYERTKALLEGFKTNEEALNITLQASEKTCKQHEERYESLKAHAKAQLEKSNKEILMLRDKYELDINKLKAITKRLEIKCSSLEVSLQQKTEECAALSALCDEVTGKRM